MKRRLVMHDQMFDRDYQAHRKALNASIDELLAGIARAFLVLNRITWSAPWSIPARRDRTGIA
jgi:hypothetical protein